jgi:hypothetical protein
MQFNKEDIEYLLSKKMSEYEKTYGKDFKFAVIEVVGLEKQLNPEPTQVKETRLIPLVKWNNYHPEPTVKALRMLVYKKDENGFDRVVVRRGSRVLINENEYFKWLEGKNMTA